MCKFLSKIWPEKAKPQNAFNDLSAEQLKALSSDNIRFEDTDEKHAIKIYSEIERGENCVTMSQNVGEGSPEAQEIMTSWINDLIELYQVRPDSCLEVLKNVVDTLDSKTGIQVPVYRKLCEAMDQGVRGYCARNDVTNEQRKLISLGYETIDKQFSDRLRNSFTDDIKQDFHR